MVPRIRVLDAWRHVIPVLVAVALGAGLAHAQVANGSQYSLVVRHSGQCLDIAGGSVENDAYAVQSPCTGSASQRWTFEFSGVEGYYILVARHSGKALDVQYALTTENARVDQWNNVAQWNQRWLVEAAPGGAYRLLAGHSGLALSVLGGDTTEGASIVQASFASADWQLWELRQPGTPPPPPPPPPTSVTRADATRLLEQSTWGPTPALVDRVRSIGIDAFLNEQFDAPMSSYPNMPLVPGTRDNATCPSGSPCARDNYSMYLLQNRFFTNGLYGADQLRQRVAFALHQILVVSGVEVTLPSRMTPYLQMLDRHAFGNFRDLLVDLTLNPAMGAYLDVNGNTRTRPNENYAREILQLFSIGTIRLNPDGTPQLDGSGEPIPSYTQATVDNFARVFTGWRFAPNPAAGVTNYFDPMVANESQHDRLEKTLLDGAVLPANQSTRQDLEGAIDNIFNHPNVGPFIGKQLVQHLVTSNPSTGYVARVARVFNGEAGTPRGDMRAVIRAILTDPEARGDAKTEASYGRLRHPAQFVLNILRAFDAMSADRMQPSDGYLNPQTSPMGMDVFRPASVFSYYSPFGAAPGTGGLRGPEFGILSTATALRRANFVNTIVFSRIATSANAPAGTSLDLAPLQALANDPNALVDTLNDRVLHGTMSSDMRSAIVRAVSAVAAANTLKRARTALYLVLTSSQYQVER